MKPNALMGLTLAAMLGGLGGRVLSEPRKRERSAVEAAERIAAAEAKRARRAARAFRGASATASLS